uniref:Uncharacterized protein n=1 Tax=Rhodnius prolixus TaxID=13249 RepID=T1HMA6_RHOPR
MVRSKMVFFCVDLTWNDPVSKGSFAYLTRMQLFASCGQSNFWAVQLLFINCIALSNFPYSSFCYEGANGTREHSANVFYRAVLTVKNTFVKPLIKKQQVNKGKLPGIKYWLGYRAQSHETTSRLGEEEWILGTLGCPLVGSGMCWSVEEGRTVDRQLRSHTVHCSVFHCTIAVFRGCRGSLWFAYSDSIACDKRVSCSQRSQVTQHIATGSHIENKNRKKERTSYQAFLTSPPSSKSTLSTDLCRALVRADIPFHKLKNPHFKGFLETYIGKKMPDESTLRKNYLEDIYKDTLTKIREHNKDGPIWVSIDETTVLILSLPDSHFTFQHLKFHVVANNFEE